MSGLQPLAPIRLCWDLLDRRERRQALLVLGVMLLSALAGAAMVLSVMPFLSLIADPGMIATTPALAWAQARLGLESNYDFVVAIGALTALFILFANAVQLLKVFALTRFATMRVHSLAMRLLAAYLRQPYEFFLNRHSADMTTGVLSEAEQVVGQFIRPIGDLLAGLLSVLAIMAALIWVSPAIALGGLVVIGGSYALIYQGVRLRLSRLGRERVAANGLRFRIAGEALGGIKDVKVLGREYSYAGRFEAPSHDYARTRATAGFIAEAPRYLLQTILFAGIVLVCLVLIDREGFESGAALGGLLPLIGAFALGGQKLLPEVQAIFGALAQLRFGAAAVESVHGGLEQARGLPGLPPERPQPLRLRERLTFEQVSYRYPEADLAGLTGVALEIRRGERIGIVGATGAGKSTFADLVLGLLQPQAGRICVDGVPVTAATLRAWQAGIGYVPQEIFITDATIAENIAFGVAPEAIDHARVAESARLARIDGFILSALPQGFATRVGERGVRLSGGQRQRIGIARALYHDAGLIVFDEATSALDSATEREVMTAIEQLPGDKTVLLIAHRLSTVRSCDRILVLDNGQVAGFAPWAELLRDCPPFRRLVDVAEAA